MCLRLFVYARFYPYVCSVLPITHRHKNCHRLVNLFSNVWSLLMKLTAVALIGADHAASQVIP
jgi:hypothetical protein